MKNNYKALRLGIQLVAGVAVIMGGRSLLGVTMPILLGVMVLGGAFFCGWMCPFGTLQDVISQLTFKIKKRQMPVPLQKVMAGLRYVLLATTTLLSFSFVFTLMNYDARINFFSITSGRILSVGAYAVIAVYLLAAAFFERPFCSYMCPEGAKYGLMSGLRPFRIVRNQDACVGCGKCDKACPMHIEITKGENVMSLQCISCFSCLAACPKKGTLKYGFMKLNRKKAVLYGLSILMAMAMAMAVGAKAATQETLAYQDGTYSGSANGFRGPMSVEVNILGGKITSVNVTSSQDDRKWLERALSVIPDLIVQNQSADVDTVSGATYSSRGIINAVKDALSNAQ